MRNSLKSGLLSAISASFLLTEPVNADVPNLNIIFDQLNYAPGDIGTFTLTLDASTLGDNIDRLDFLGGNLPSFFTITGHDIYSSGTDTSGSYVSGFLNGKVVSNNDGSPNNLYSANPSLYGKQASIGTDVIPTDNSVLNASGNVVMYNFTVSPFAPQGNYSFCFETASLGSFTGGGSTSYNFDNTVDPEENTLNVNPASFNIVPEPTSTALLGAGVLGLSGLSRRRRRVESPKLAGSKGLDHYIGN